MDILKKHRLNYTITMVAMAACFLLLIFGIFIGINVATNNADERVALNQALSSKDNMFDKDAPKLNIQCFTFSDDINDPRLSPNAEFYGDSLDEIKALAIKTKSGKFTYNNKYFIVDSKTISTHTLYAVYDRTAHHEELIDRILLLLLLYCLSLIVVGLIAYLISSRIMEPVKDAMEKQRDLIANASHELKTPLTVISTNLDVIKSEPSTTIEENEKEIETIDSQIIRMKGLIQNMLELSKLEEKELPKEKLNFSEIVDGACLSFEAVCFEQGNSLVSDVAKDVYVIGDKNSLERLIIILLDNANKYSGENGKIGIKLIQEQKKIHLTVMNTGAVISNEDAKHVFDRFYRTDGARENKDNQSFGLGLSIAHATIINHKGSISCRGIEGKGTIFDIFLPSIKDKKL